MRRLARARGGPRGPDDRRDVAIRRDSDGRVLRIADSPHLHNSVRDPTRSWETTSGCFSTRHGLGTRGANVGPGSRGWESAARGAPPDRERRDPLATLRGGRRPSPPTHRAPILPSDRANPAPLTCHVPTRETARSTIPFRACRGISTYDEVPWAPRTEPSDDRKSLRRRQLRPCSNPICVA